MYIEMKLVYVGDDSLKGIVECLGIVNPPIVEGSQELIDDLRHCNYDLLNTYKDLLRLLRKFLVLGNVQP